MGRPKAIRNRDKIPLLSSSVNSSEAVAFQAKKTHLSFDDTDEISQAREVKNSSSNLNTVSSENSREDTSLAPEFVSNDNEEILRLKRLYEEMREPIQKRLKRKRKEEMTDLKPDQTKVLSANIALDETILEAFTESKDNKGRQAIGEECTTDGDEVEDKDDEEEEEEEITVDRYDKHGRKSKRIARATHVSVLNESSDPLQYYQMSKTAEAFETLKYSNVPRVKYLTFISQKKPIPAREFVIKK